MKLGAERCLSLLGFSPQSCVCPQQTLGSSIQVVVPTPGDDVRVIYRALIRVPSHLMRWALIRVQSDLRDGH